MLEALRKRTGSWVVKGFMALLALSFGIWGIGDIFRRPQDPTVAEVGSVKIHASDLQKEYTRTLESLRRMTGGQIDAEQARALGAVGQALDSLVARAAMRQEIDRLSLGVPDDVVRRAITEAPSFRSQTGTFDRMQYLAVLRQNQLSEDEYVGLLRRDLAQNQLLGSLSAGLVAPRPLVRTLYDFREQRRIADVVTVKSESFSDLSEPDEAALTAYYDAHQDQFTAPEFRRVTFVTIRPADLLDEIVVDDEEVREEYEYRLEEFTTPERRDLDQVVFDDLDTATAAAGRIRAGEDFFAVGSALTGQAEPDMKLGQVTRDALIGEVAAVAFALDAGALSPPIETPLGWYLVRVNAVSPGGTKSFEDVAEEIHGELKIARAAEATFELGNRFEDERAGGAKLEDSARPLGLAVETVGPIDRNGYQPDGKTADALPPIQDFLGDAFAAAEGSESELKEAAGSIFYVLRVDGITPPALRPLAEVRVKVADAWRAEQQRARARASAETLAGRAAEGGLAAAAAAMGLAVETTAAFARDGRDLEISLSNDIITAIFALDPGGVTEAMGLGPDRFVVAQVKELVPAPAPSEEDSATAQIARQLELGMQSDLMGALDDSLRQKYRVRVNNALVESLF